MSQVVNGEPPLVHMFWAFGAIGYLQNLSISSFLHNGYRVVLWTYNAKLRVDFDVAIRDASDILDPANVFLNKKNSYAGFSDIFRYALLSKIGGLYSDIDVVALKPWGGFRKPFLVQERIFAELKCNINGNIIYNPYGSAGTTIITDAFEFAMNFPKDNIIWGEIGPKLLTDLCAAKPDHGFDLMAPEFSNHIDYWLCPAKLLDFDLTLPADSYFLHLYNQTWKNANVNPNPPFPDGSLMDYFDAKFMPNRAEL